ncbi:MAG: peptide chain release factor 1 [Bacteroidia bacterium]|nr:peptide chain release factor 1 [Bacteroidia bacterium]
MLEKIAKLEARFEEVSQDILDPAVISDMKRYKALNIEYRQLEKIIAQGRIYREIVEGIRADRDILEQESDPDLRELAKEDLSQLNARLPAAEEALKILLIPQDPNDARNCVLEINAGTGGDEACLFAGDLLRMYQRYCERRGWRFEISSASAGAQGGYREAVATVSGEDAYGVLKYEGGVHRVQRVPRTETQGRIHTSAATVAVMPEAEDFDVELNEQDVVKEITTSQGPGGQSVNTTYSAVKLTHKPTGIRVSMQDEKSQHKNLEKAYRILRARIYQHELEKRKQAEDQLRRSMVGSGDRSEKIRTYNFPQSRVTDHRIGLTLYNLPVILDGDLDPVLEPLRLSDTARKLEEGGL